MTNKDYRTAQELLTNQDICKFADRMCKKGEVDPIVDYPQRLESEVMPSAARRQMYLAKAIDLLRRMIFLRANGLEILRASEYLMVVMDSLRCKLDWRRCEQMLKIPELERKYSRESFYGMDIPAEDLKEIIARDNGYYPVPIKEGTT